jgi:hypothetical protein
LGKRPRGQSDPESVAESDQKILKKSEAKVLILSVSVEILLAQTALGFVFTALAFFSPHSFRDFSKDALGADSAYKQGRIKAILFCLW